MDEAHEEGRGGEGMERAGGGERRNKWKRGRGWRRKSRYIGRDEVMEERGKEEEGRGDEEDNDEEERRRRNRRGRRRRRSRGKGRTREICESQKKRTAAFDARLGENGGWIVQP